MSSKIVDFLDSIFGTDDVLSSYDNNSSSRDDVENMMVYHINH